MTTYKQHHYVPRFLLEHWHSYPDGKLTQFRWAHGRMAAKRFAAKSVAKMEHLYSLQRTNTNPDVKIERDFLGPHVDDPASRAHKTILQHGIRSLITDSDRSAWSRFLVSLMLRVPVKVEYVRSKGREVLKAQLDEGPEDYLKIRGDAPETTLRDWVEKHAPSLLDDFGMMALPKLVESPLLNNALLDATWATRSLKDSRFDLLIADNPLIYIGTLASRFLISLPITPTLMFLAFNDNRTWDNVSELSDESFIRAANLSTVRQVERYTYATNDRQESFVAKYLQREQR